jgi:hypothetical protein
MASLSVTEKSHWRDRIAARIDKAVERIKARHPALFERVKRQAHAEALASLGLGEPYAGLETILTDEKALAARKKRVQRQMLAALRGVPLDEVLDNFSVRYGPELPLPVEVAEAIQKRQAAHTEQLSAEDEVGREIARLEAERDGLLDTIWLATSPTEIRALWTKVSALLGDEPSPLEREALRIEPAQEG